ncbi:hypothetical protein D9M71_508410 [compost metagenome]
MAALMDRADQAVSVTTMVRSFSAKLREIASRETEKLVVFKDNEPAAVILNVEAYQELLDELEDLRVERIARDRLVSFDRSEAISHEDMMARFAD